MYILKNATWWSNLLIIHTKLWNYTEKKKWLETDINMQQSIFVLKNLISILIISVYYYFFVC